MNYKSRRKAGFYVSYYCKYFTAIFFDYKNFTMSKIYSIQTTQNIPIDIDKAWDFFSKPENLKVLTPTHLDFSVLSKPQDTQMYAGQIIEYKVKPLLDIPLYWMTEITHVQEKVYFIDEQRFGPYSFWHHQHHFKAIGNDVKMTDIVHYSLPLWFLGDIAHALFIHKQLKQIFDFRYQKIENLFGKWDK